MSKAWADVVDSEALGEAPVVVPKPSGPERGDAYFKVRQLEDEVARLHLVVRTLETGLERAQRSVESMRVMVEELYGSRDVLFRELGAESMMAKLRDERAARAGVAPRPAAEAGEEAPWQTARRRGARKGKGAA